MSLAICNLLNKRSKNHIQAPFLQILLSKHQTERGKEKNCLNSKIFTFLKSAHQNFDENAFSRLNISTEENESPYFRVRLSVIFWVVTSQSFQLYFPIWYVEILSIVWIFQQKFYDIYICRLSGDMDWSRSNTRIVVRRRGASLQHKSNRYKTLAKEKIISISYSNANI